MGRGWMEVLADEVGDGGTADAASDDADGGRRGGVISGLADEERLQRKGEKEKEKESETGFARHDDQIM